MPVMPLSAVNTETERGAIALIGFVDPTVYG